jgi:uncharacterized protein YegP (UPF0339 family)
VSPIEIELRKSQWSPTWYWRIVSSNGQIMATSESYWDRQEAIRAVVSVQAGALAAPFRELTDRETADSLVSTNPRLGVGQRGSFPDAARRPECVSRPSPAGP